MWDQTAKVPPSRFELETFRMWSERDNQLHHGGKGAIHTPVRTGDLLHVGQTS